MDAHHVLANWKQNPRNLVRLTRGNDGVQFTNMAMTEAELMTQQQDITSQQQEPSIQESHSNNTENEAHNNNTENEGTTLTTITTRAPTSHTAGHGWRPGNRRGGGRGRGHNRDVITCFRCGQRGHYASECNTTTEEVDKYHKSQTTINHGAGEQLLNSGVLEDHPNTDITTNWMFNQIHVIHDRTHIKTWHGGRLPLEWVLLDNRSTIDVFVNCCLLQNIRRIGQYMYIHCTAGVT